ncbi:chemotaxis protein CheB [Novilysobacter ciconiae]|nr:chemotaxis protein CheB [Lysobacter ciconiae]
MSPPADLAAHARLPFPVVGVGASAGGLAALQRFFEQMPADPGMAFVVVLHLSPRHQSNAGAVLQRATRMPVEQVTGSVPLKANHVYVISPRSDLAMADGHLEVRDQERQRGAPVAVDIFLRTLADTHRERAVGIVLSGGGSDGTAGLRWIREMGGVTMAQLPEDAEHPDMPRHAIATGSVDFVLPAAELPQALLDVWRNARNISVPPSGDPEASLAVARDEGPESETALREILAILAERSGHEFTHYKRATVLRRIERRLQVRMLADLPSYRDYLRAHPEETPPLLADMLISVTRFFRDREAFDTLERDIIPPMFERLAQARSASADDGVDDGSSSAAASPQRAGQGAGGQHQRIDGPERLRVWVPGCATGEEAYSLAMLLQDEAQRFGIADAFQLFATDIDERAIALARRGCYPRSILSDVPPRRLREFFSVADDHYQVRKPLRERVLFTAHNMLRDPPFSRLDLISCRNVLIYLSREIQEKLLEMFHFSLRPGGMLFLGSAETPEAAGGLFEPVDNKHRIYRARPGGSLPRRIPSVPLRIPALPAAPVRAPADVPQRFAGLHQQVLEAYAPPSAIIDSTGAIVHMTQGVARYLRHAAGVPSHNLAALVEPDLRMELRMAMFQAAQTRERVTARPVRRQADGHTTLVTLTVQPFRVDAGAGVVLDGAAEAAPTATAEFMLVLFARTDADAAESSAKAAALSTDAVARQLEQALQDTRQQLQATVEESNLSAEELRASNEELQAINEELCSTTEELETSSEELQSVNEELLTVNAELKAKVEETERVNDDLKNFLAATEIATLFIDRQLRVRRYTPAAESLFSLIASDLGRDLFDIRNRLHYPGLRADMMAVMETLQTIEQEVRTDDGRWLICRILPYQTGSRHIEGVVLTLVDITPLRRAQEEIARGEEDMRLAFLQSADFAVVATDVDGYIIGWNSGAKAVFGYDDGEMKGKRIHALFVPEDVAAGKPEEEMENARLYGRASDERWHLRKDGSRIFCSGVMTPVDVNGLRGYVKIARDATLQHELRELSEEKLTRSRAAHAAAKASLAVKEEFLAVVSHELKHPLNLISVNAELIGRTMAPQLRNEPVAARALDAVCRAAHAQGRIVDDLLDLSRIRTGKLSLDLAPVDLAGAAQAAVEAMSAEAAAADIRLLAECPEDPVMVIADAARLNQILWNLLGNAVKFSSAGGRVRVRTRAEADFGRLDVIDNGRGISADALPRIFEMFGQGGARAASHQRGLGIGLSVVRQLAELHGGRVQARSEGPDKGACFSVWLPLQAPSLTEPAASTHDHPAGTGLCVLIVDDDPQTVDALAALLRLEGVDVLAASSGEQALQLAARRPPDVVLTDLGMPDMDGYQLLAKLRERPSTADVPVIAVTGFGGENDARQSGEAGFAGHIGKPIHVDDLLREMDAVVKVNRSGSSR